MQRARIFFHSVYTAISSNKTSTKGRITDLGIQLLLA